MPVYIIVIALVLCVIVFYISAYNKLRRLSVKVEEGSAGIDVALEKRYDMLSEEIEAVGKNWRKKLWSRKNICPKKR